MKNESKNWEEFLRDGGSFICHFRLFELTVFNRRFRYLRHTALLYVVRAAALFGPVFTR